MGRKMMRRVGMEGRDRDEDEEEEGGEVNEDGGEDEGIAWG